MFIPTFMHVLPQNLHSYYAGWNDLLRPIIHNKTCNSTQVINVIPIKVPSDLDSIHNSLDRDIWGLGYSPIDIHNLKNA